MPKDGTNRLEAFLRTPEGERFLAQSEAEAARKEAAVQARRDIAAQRAEFLRRRREVESELDRVAKAAWDVANRARAEYEALREKAAHAGRAAHSEFLAVNDGLRTTEAQLQRSADPRLQAAVEEADEALRTWSETYERLHRFRSEKATSWDGTDSWVKRYGTNEAGIDALKKAIEDAREALRKLMLVAEPEEDALESSISNLHAAIEACHGDPPLLVVQQFDSNGRSVGKPVEIPAVQ